MSDFTKGSKKRTYIFLVSVIMILVILFITKIQFKMLSGNSRPGGDRDESAILP